MESEGSNFRSNCLSPWLKSKISICCSLDCQEGHILPLIQCCMFSVQWIHLPAVLGLPYRNVSLLLLVLFAVDMASILFPLPLQQPFSK